MLASLYAPLLAYGHHGGFGEMVIHAIVYSSIFHVVGALFRGHGLIGSIIIGVIAMLVGRWVLRRFF